MSSKALGRVAFFVAGLAVAVAWAQRADAQATHWTGNSSVFWSNAGNWSSGVPTSSDLQVQFDPAYSTQLSPVNDMSNLALVSVKLGDSSTNLGGFDITGDSLTLNQNSSIGYAITDYGNNTWGLNTSLGEATTLKTNNAGTTLTLAGVVTTNGNTVTITGPGNVNFVQMVSDSGSLDMNGTGTVYVAPNNTGQGNDVYGQGRTVNFGNFIASSGTINMGSYTGWAGIYGWQDSIAVYSGADVTVSGPLVVPDPNGVQHGGPANVIEGNGTLTLAQPGTSVGNPDITSWFFRSDLCGDIISPTVGLGNTSERYVQVFAQGYQQSSSQGERIGPLTSEDLDFAGGVSGSAGLTFDGEPAYDSSHYVGSSPMQATLGLPVPSPNWTGGLTIYSGNVILSATSANSLTANNSVTFAPPDSYHATGLYLNGSSTAIGSLSGSGAGQMLLVNGGTANATLTINQTTNGTFNGTIGDGPDQGWGGPTGLIQGGQLALVFQGGANLTLNGTNYYSGGTTIQAGTLRLGSASALGASNGSLSLSGGTVDLNGNSAAVGPLSGVTGAAIINSQSTAVTLTTNSPAGSATAYAGTIGGPLGLVKGGGGALTLDAANSFSGATAVNGGQLELDFSAGGATANILPSGTVLSLSGGSLLLNGAGSGSNSQILGNLTFGPGGSGIAVTPHGASVVLTLGNTWNRSPGSAVNVSLGGATLAASPALSASSSVVVGSGATAFAVVSGASSTDWATVNGGQVVALSSGGYANNFYSTGMNTNVTAPNPSLPAFTTDTLAFRTAQAATLTLSGTGLSTVNLGGVLVGAQVGANATTISGGSLTSGSNELVLQQYNTSGNFIVNSQIVNNGGTPLLLTKAGPGTLALTNANNSFSGGTVIGGGTLVFGGAGTLGPANNSLTIAGGTLDLSGQAATVGTLSGTVGGITNNAAVAAAARLTVNTSTTTTYGGTITDGSLSGNTVALNVQGGGTLVLTGSNSYSGGTNIVGAAVSVSQDANLGTASGPLYLNGGTLNVTTPGNGKTFASYNSPTIFGDAVTDDCASTTRPISWGSSGATFNITDPADIFTISQQLTAANCQGNLVKTGPGTLWLNAPNLANTYTGSTEVLGGALILDYSGDPGYGDRYPFQPKIPNTPMVLGNGRVAEYDSGPGYYGPGAAVYLGVTVNGLTLLPGDSQLQANIVYSGFDLTGGTLTGGTSTVARQVGGSLNMQGATATYNVASNCGSPSAVTAWITTSRFIDGSNLTPTLGEQCWDTEFAGGGSPTVQPDITQWAAGQDVTNETSSMGAGPNGDVATITGSNSFSGSLAANPNLSSGSLAIDSLRILPAGASNINLGGSTLQVSSGGILVAFNCVNNSSNLTQISNGTLTAGNSNYGGDLIIQQYNTGSVYPQYSPIPGALLISAVIANAPNPADRNGEPTSGSAIISGLASTSDLYPGMPVSGAGIPTGATIAVIDNSTTISLSVPATAGDGNTPVDISFQSANGLTISGSGQTILTAANTFTGPTTVGGGTLTLANSLALQDSPFNPVGGGTLSFGTLTSATFGGLTGGGTLALTNTGSAPVALSVGNNNLNSTFSGVLQGAGSLNKVGGGVLALNGANAYTGGTTISGGVLQAGSDSALGLNNLTMSGGSLDLDGNGPTVLALNGTGVIGNSQSGASNLSPLTVANGGSFSGTIQDGLGTGNAPVSLTLTGGTLVLSGDDTYSGETLVEGGELVITTAESLPARDALAIGPGGTFLFDPSVTSSAMVSGQAELATVPEPSTLVLLLAGAALALVGLRRPGGQCNPG